MSGFETNALGMYPNIYNNQIALNDLTETDLYFPNPMMSMNGSIFGDMSGMNYGTTPGLGMGSGMMSGMTPGMMPSMMPSMMLGFGGASGNYEDYYKQYEKYQDFMIENSLRQQQKSRNAELRLNSPVEGLKAKAAILHDKIKRNEQQQIHAAYDSFVQSVKELYGGDITESEARNRASALYKDITEKTIPDDIRTYGRDSLTQGFLQTLTLGFADKKTAEENVAELTGQPVGRKERLKRIGGNIAGGAIFGGGAFFLSKYLLSIAKISAKSKTAWGLAIGAIAGGLAAISTAK